jgi:EmrB/QacA subfamily drug resistance transporter
MTSISMQEQAAVETAAPYSHRELRNICLGIMPAMLLGAMDQTIVGPALPTIGRTLGDVENLSWVVTAYLLTGTAITPLYGKLADIYGRRVVLLCAIAIFALSSVACALAPSMLILIGARAMQGFGGGALISLVQTIVADVVAPRDRGRYMAYFITVAAAISVGGPLVGGLLTQYVHWSMIFWLNVPLGAIALFTVDRVMRRMPVVSHPHRLDVLGAALMMAASVVLLLALTWGGVRYAWLSKEIALLILGSLALWLLFAWRLLRAEEPFLPLRLLSNTIIRNGIIARGLGQGVLVGMTIFMPLYFEVVRNLTVAESGLALIPLMAGLVVGGQTAGQIVTRVGYYKIFPMISLPINTAVLVVFAIWPTELPIWSMYVLLVIYGLGLGPMLPVSTIIVQNAVTRAEMGIATSTMNFARTFGGALVVALFGAILLGGVGGEGVSLVTLMRGASSADLGVLFRYVFISGVVVMTLCYLCFVFIEEAPLRTTAHTEA